MYGRQDNTNDNSQPSAPWLVRAEVTIRHGGGNNQVTSSPGQAPRNISPTVPDPTGLRMVYRWGSDEPNSSSIPSNSYGFQRGNITFTSTPPPKPSVPVRSHTIPRTGGSSLYHNDSRERANVSDSSGYNSEQFSYSSLPSRRSSIVTQQNNRRCKSTCSIVLSTVDGSNNQSIDTRDNSLDDKRYWHYRPSHQHISARYRFNTLPEVCEDCSEGSVSSNNAFTTHFCTRVPEKTANKTTSISKDAASQTTDIESHDTQVSSTSQYKVRRKTVHGSQQLIEQKKKNPEIKSPSVGTTRSTTTTDQEKSDSSSKDDSSKKKSRTVHIDVYCTGSDNDDSTDSSLEDTRNKTPKTVFENEDIKITHTLENDGLPRGFKDEKAFLRQSSEQRTSSFRHAPMRMPSLSSSKGYESDDVLSSLYPSQFSSYSAIRDLDSVPWSAASSSAAISHGDYDSAAATSSKDTFSDIDSLLNSKTGLTPCDSFEYADSSDRDRIRKMEAIWAKSGSEDGFKPWRSPQIERKHLLQNRKMKEYLEKHEIGWSSDDNEDNNSAESTDDESIAVGWSFIPQINENSKNVFKREDSTVRGTSKDYVGPFVSETHKNKNQQEDFSDSTTRSDLTFAFRDQIGSFASKSPSPLPSKITSRVTSPFTTPQGEKTDHILKASIFGPVISAFRKPGHHIGPSKNPSCSCEHCRRYFEENFPRGRSSSLSEFERRLGNAFKPKIDIIKQAPTSSKY